MDTKNIFEIVLGFVNTLILCITGYFIYRAIYSPVDAVKIGRKLNTEQQKDDSKRNLFLSLFSLRGNPVHYDFVKGLNQIDIVFSDSPTVLNEWHVHYNSLNTMNLVDEETVWERQRVNLLSVMAESLGYPHIRQTELLQHYTPVGHSNWLKDEHDFRQAQLTFFRSNAAMAQRLMERMDIQDSEQDKLDEQK